VPGTSRSATLRSLQRDLEERARIFQRASSHSDAGAALKATRPRNGIAKTNPSPPPRNLGLLELIRAKRERDWRPSNEELKKGFRGWHQRGYLPHFDAPRVTQFVTFQLNDSFPAPRRAEWEVIVREPDNSAKRRKLEAWLDRGHGECWLRRRDVAEVVEKILLEAMEAIIGYRRGS